ncbi:MAG: endolytic transglycosylase MltG [Puia sp.]|nr:endolytic transglycosylase MltG [Puia sp.]
MSLRKRIFGSVFAIVILAALFSAWRLLGPATAFSGEKYYLYIGTGMKYEEVLDRLERDTVLESPAFFKWVADRVDYPRNVKAGKYEIRKGMNLLNIVRILRNGRQVPVHLIITKLRTPENLASFIGKHFECDSVSAMAYFRNNDSLKEYGLDSNTFLTAVLPNTYTFFWNTTPSAIFRKIRSTYTLFWTPARKTAAAIRGLNPTTAYILASIVEEETNKQDDKPKIASVYLNRMAKGMKLGADPTVKYALHDFELKRIYDKYLQVESPYNTYKHAGLPPGPICTPSEQTLDAVLSSPQTDYLYFVAKPDFSGYSNFAATYEEHLQNAREYQKALDEQMAIRAASEKAARK